MSSTSPIGSGLWKNSFQIEHDKQDRHQVVAHIELHARIFKRLEAALVGRSLVSAGALWPEQGSQGQEDDANNGGNTQEQQNRQVLGQIHVFTTQDCIGELQQCSRKK
jgi:hypothetical protein